MAADGDFGDRLTAGTEAYLDRLDACVQLLPELLDQYESGGAYRETADRIAEIESECDRMIREITGLITNAGPEDVGLRNSRLTINEAALIEFYNDVDVLANVTERIARELIAMGPAPDTDCFEGLREMAEAVAGTTGTLGDVVLRFVRSLGSPEASDTLIEGIESIRAMESRCDHVKDRVITAAFDDAGIDQPLVYRELAVLFDDLANTMEDVTDRIVVIASDEPGIVTDPDPDGA